MALNLPLLTLRSIRRRAHWPRLAHRAAAALLLHGALLADSLAQEVSPTLPPQWNGLWRGGIEVMAGGQVTHRAQMELSVAPIAGRIAWTWTQTYTGQPPRAYELRPAESDAGRFVLDEKNGVLLDGQLIGATLLSTFRTGGVLLASRFELRGDELVVEIATFADPPQAAGKQQVAALPFRSIQRGVLRRTPG